MSCDSAATRKEENPSHRPTCSFVMQIGGYSLKTFQKTQINVTLK